MLLELMKEKVKTPCQSLSEYDDKVRTQTMTNFLSS